MKMKSGDPRKRRAEGDNKTLKARHRVMLMSKDKEIKEEILRLLNLFEEQYPESSGYLYDDIPYMLSLGAIVVHRASCELQDKTENYNPSVQLDTLKLLPAMRKEIEGFLVRNQLDKAETYSIFAAGHLLSSAP